MGFKKLLLFVLIILFISCTPQQKQKQKNIMEISYDNDVLCIKLAKNENIIGKINEVFIGDNGGLSLLNELEVKETEEIITIKILITEYCEYYELNKNYPLIIKWTGGWIKGNCVYKDKYFLVTNEKHYNKSAF